MSRAALQQVIDKAVSDDTFFALLQSNPDEAIKGFDLEDHERRLFELGTYNVIIRSARKDDQDKAKRDSERAQKDAAEAAAALAPPVPAAQLAPTPKVSVPGLVFLGLVIVLGAGVGGFRLSQQQWPWEAAGLARTAAPASIPSPVLGASPRTTPAASRPASASAAASGQASTQPSASASPSGQGPGSAQPSASGQGSQPAASSTARPSSQPSASSTPLASLRPSGQASGSAQPAANATPTGTSPEKTKAYFDAVGQPLSRLQSTFRGVVTDFRAGNDPGPKLTDLSKTIADLQQQAPAASPPDDLKLQHAQLQQALPLLQANNDQLKNAVAQKNIVQAQLIAIEMAAVIGQFDDLMSFASLHPEFVQAVNSAAPFNNAVDSDIMRPVSPQRTTTAVSLRIPLLLHNANPSAEQISDTLHQAVVQARKAVPQATQIEIDGFKETSPNVVGGQAGSAIWYCGPDSKPSDGSSTNWQDYCGKIYLSTAGGSSAIPY